MATPTTFRAVNLPQAGPEPDLFGLWQPEPVTARSASDEAVPVCSSGDRFAHARGDSSGVVGSQSAPGVPALPGEQDFALTEAELGPLCWRVDLSPDPRQAAADLDRAQARMAATARDLDDARGRLAGFAASDGLPPPDETSFGLDAAPPAPEPEADLQALLDELPWARAPEQAGEQAKAAERARVGEPADYDFEVPSAGRIAEAVAGYRAYLRQFYQSVSHYARVETAQQGRVLARTRVGWTGDMDTDWHARVTAEQIALHQRSLALALDTRAGLLRIAVLVVQGARLLAQLSVMSAAAPSLILAAPAAWRFIQQVLAEARRWQGRGESSA